MQTSAANQPVICYEFVVTESAKDHFAPQGLANTNFVSKQNLFKKKLMMKIVRKIAKRARIRALSAARARFVPNIGAVFKTEISRISRREIRQETHTIRKASAAYRRDIAALKRQLHDLQQKVAHMGKAVARADGSNAAVEPAQQSHRFVAKGLRSMRNRLGLSAPELAKLVGVSTQSVYNWELKKSVPRKQQLAALAPLRSLGKREARRRLEDLGKRKNKKK